MIETPYLLAGFIVFVFALLALDLGIMHRKEHAVRPKEAMYGCLFYFTLAMLFAAGVWHYAGAEKGAEFLTGYLVELSLSIDNLFVFILIFTHFMVPPQFQHRVLFWGILGALVMRGIFILAGTAIIQAFGWVMYLFGAFLIFTSIKMLFAADAEPDMENNRIVKFLNSRFRITKDYEGKRFFLRKNGVLWVTPLFVVLVLIEISDLVFAVDSIPAIFAVTNDPFIIYTSNIFAILGLRSLYFAIANVIHRFEYLKYGLSMILLLIGTKMVVNEYFHAKIIPTNFALVITAGLIIGSVILSLLKTRGKIVEKQFTGWVPGSDGKNDDTVS